MKCRYPTPAGGRLATCRSVVFLALGCLMGFHGSAAVLAATGGPPSTSPGPVSGRPPSIVHPRPLPGPISNVFLPANPPRPMGGTPPAPVSPPTQDEATLTNLTERLQVRPVAPGIFQIGQVRLNKPERTVSFPAVANMERGAVEFLVVTGFGRTHESVLRSDVDPYQIHIAMLLLGARGNTNALEGIRTEAGPTETPYAKAIGGDRVAVEVAWKSGEREIRRPGEELVVNLAASQPMTPGDWTYTGSAVANGVFLAQVDGSIVAVMREPAALVNNPREGADRDEIWAVNTNSVPALDTPVQVVLRLRPAEAGRP